MLTRLPNEILIKIFIQLHQDDQMECKFVCHDWNQIIEDFVLYRTVFIYAVVNIKRLIEKVQQKPDIANKIERVMINIDPEDEKESDTSSDAFLSLLTNLKSLHCSMNNYANGNKASYPWHNQIEYISEQSYYPIACHLLSFTTCPNLTTLKISRATFHDFSILKNAPALTSLTIERTFVGFYDLELMHESLPQLKTIDINVLVYPGNFQSDKIITPATSVTDFLVNIYTTSGSFNAFVEYLAYIYKKYPNLTNLKYINGTEVPTFDEMKHISEFGWTPLFQKLGSQLKKLGLNSSGYCDDLFGMLDRFDCKVNYLTLDYWTFGISEKMAHYKQMFHIQTLVLEHTECEALRWLKYLVVLKKLKLAYCTYNDSSNNIQMSCILDNCPSTLESLSLEGITLVIDPGYTGTSNIKTLSFNGMKLHSKADVFMSRCFPRLSTLKMKYCNLIGKTFNLETMNLLDFHYVEHYFERGRTIILIKTLKNNEQRSYLLDSYKHRASSKAIFAAFYPQNYLPIKSYPASEMNDTVPNFTLVCNSVRKLVFI